MKALIKNNKVVDLKNNEFEVHPSFFWLDAPQACEIGWVLIDGILQEDTNKISINNKIEDNFILAIKTLLHNTALEKNYDNEQSIIGYINSVNPVWKQEAQAYILWRDAVWSYAFIEFEKFNKGLRDLINVDTFIKELPTIIWTI